MGVYQRPMEFPTFIKRSFMYVPHFAEVLMQYIHRLSEMPKILHISGSKVVSWYDFMSDLAPDYGIGQALVKKRKHEIPNTFAPRPQNGGLDVSWSMDLGLHQYSYLDGILQMRKDDLP
jgi:dTDP-4-dehydrorhamnose reductase